MSFDLRSKHKQISYLTRLVIWKFRHHSMNIITLNDQLFRSQFYSDDSAGIRSTTIHFLTKPNSPHMKLEPHEIICVGLTNNELKHFKLPVLLELIRFAILKVKLPY